MTAAAFLVMNPASAGGRTHRNWPAIARALGSAGVPFDLHRTAAAGDATQAVRAALAGGYRTVVVVVHIGLAAAAERIEQQGALAGRVDFADGQRRFFVNIADCGMGGEVAARVNRRGRKRGGARGSAMFLAISLSTLLRYASRVAHIEIDGMRIDRDVRSVVVANGRYFGGGMRVAPGAELDDGRFDVVIIGETGRTRALIGIPSLYRGRHVRRPEVEVHRARVVRVSCDGAPMLFDVEGEQVGTTPATLTCLPRVISICAPEVGEGRSATISC